MTATGAPTLGVEEEYFLLDPLTRTLRPASDSVIRRAADVVGDLVSGEFTRSQLEVKTPPCENASQLRTALVWLREEAAAAAAAEGLRICASGTPLLSESEPLAVGEHPRYRAGQEQFRAMMHDFAICSLHIHIHMPDRALSVRVSNNLRPWLPMLVALAANSPFYQGKDTGYADWRAMIRSRFPCLGPPPYAESLHHHEELAAAIAASGAMLDAKLPYWDVRLNPRLPTLEIRAMDVTADIDDAIALAVLVRALVVTEASIAAAGDIGPRPSSEVLRSAYWRAARDGWSGCGVDALTGDLLPTPVQATGLAKHVEQALEDAGDRSIVTAFLSRLAARGSGAEIQRAAYARHGALSGVVDDLIALTGRT